MSVAVPANLPDAAAFRRAMGRFATGVAVVSLVRGDDSIAAMTINSLVSVSLDPMLVSWNLQNSSSQFAEFAHAERFAFSILAEDQQALARRYAARGDSGLVHTDFGLGSGGIPVIRGALASLACRSFAAHAAGDHTLILGQVEALELGPAEAQPLLFFGGKFGSLEHDH